MKKILALLVGSGVALTSLATAFVVLEPASAAPRPPAVHAAAVVVATGQAPSDVGAAGFYGRQLDIWNFVVGANYAQALMDAEAAARAAAHRGGGGGGCAGWQGPQSNGVSDAPPGFPGYIIARESGGDPTALNCSGAEGPAQILGSHFAPGGGCYGQTYGQCWATLWANGSGASNWSTR